MPSLWHILPHWRDHSHQPSGCRVSGRVVEEAPDRCGQGRRLRVAGAAPTAGGTAWRVLLAQFKVSVSGRLAVAAPGCQVRDAPQYPGGSAVQRGHCWSALHRTVQGQEPPPVREKDLANSERAVLLCRQPRAARGRDLVPA